MDDALLLLTSFYFSLRFYVTDDYEWNTQAHSSTMIIEYRKERGIRVQKATSLIFCLFIVLLFIFPSIGEAAGQVKNADEVANETENFKKVQSLISE